MIKVKQVILTALMAITLAACGQSSNVKTLKQDELNAKATEKNVVVIDVRTPSEIQEGFIPQATAFVDYTSASFQTEVQKLDTSKTYVVYCRSGGRSAKAASFMASHGFSNVYNLEGGINNYSGTLKQQ